MENTFLNGKPLSKEAMQIVEEELLGESGERDLKTGQRYVRLHKDFQEVCVNPCAALGGIDSPEKLDGLVAKFPEISGLTVIPNEKWNRNSADPFARLKVYNSPGITYETEGRVKTIRCPMPFLGTGPEDCWAEIQFRFKRTIVRTNSEGRSYQLNLENSTFARKRSFDTRLVPPAWVDETKPIKPKLDKGSHGFLSLRLYHEDHKPANQPDWSFEPLYVLIGDTFFKVEAKWPDREIVITITLLDEDDPSIPAHLFFKR